MQTVDFRQYVGVVMAKEWPSHLPRQALEAAAVAVKQYAWYHALAGNHRSTFRTSGGCYDVMDSTRDQLYKPELVRVSGKLRSVVGATWGLSLRKGGEFFMTGYRRGGDNPCGADADGWKLFARSVIDCAKKGLSRQEIQARYYGNNVSFVWAGGGAASAPPPPRKPAPRREPRGGNAAASDAEPSKPQPPADPAPPPPPPPPADPAPAPPPPADPPSPPAINLSVGIAGEAERLSLSWAGSDDDLRYAVQELVEDEWLAVALPSRTATELPDAGGFDSIVGDDRRYRVRAIDGDGLRSPWTVSPTVTARPYADIAHRMGMMGNPGLPVEAAEPSEVVLSYSTDESGVSTLVVDARAVALLGAAGPDRGEVRVTVDGVEHGVTNLNAAERRVDAVIFSQESEEIGTHVIRLEPVDQSGPSSAWKRWWSIADMKTQHRVSPANVARNGHCKPECGGASEHHGSIAEV